MSAERLYSIREICSETGLSSWRLYEAVANRELSVVRFTPRGRIRFTRAAVDAWLKSHEVPAGDAPAGARLELNAPPPTRVRPLPPPKGRRPSFA